MTPTEKIDAALESVLVTIARRMDDYNPVTLGRMRKAMKEIMTSSYIEGSNDAHQAFKDNHGT